VWITPSALDDISDIADFYFELVDEESSQRFINDVFDTITSLDSFPESNAYFDEEHGLRRVRVRNHKVSVVYIVDNGVYEVIAFGAFHVAVSQANIRRDWLKDLKNWTNSLISYIGQKHALIV